MLEFPAYLLQIDKTALGTKVTSRVMESKWGGQGSHMIGQYIHIHVIGFRPNVVTDQSELYKVPRSLYPIMCFPFGMQTERTDVTLNVQQAEATRDALAKGLYSRLFDFLVNVSGSIQI